MILFLYKMNVYTIDDLELIKKLLKELADKDEIKAMRALLRNNNNCSKLNPKELNKEIVMINYKFTTRGGTLILIKNKRTRMDERNKDIINKILCEIK